MILVEAGRATAGLGGKAAAVQQRPIALPPRLSDAELEAHAAFIATLGEKAIWREYDARSVNTAQVGIVNCGCCCCCASRW